MPEFMVLFKKTADINLNNMTGTDIRRVLVTLLFFCFTGSGFDGAGFLWNLM